MFSTISHLKHKENTNTITILIVGAEGTGKHDLSKCLLDFGSGVNMKVHTCSSLPLPEGSELYSSSVDFVCFLLQLSSKESFETVLYSIGKLDINYFLGRTAIVVNTMGTGTEQAGDSVMPVSVKDLGTQYGVPVLFRDIQVEQDKVDLSRKLMMLIQSAVGLRSSLNPLLFDTVSV